MQEEFIAGYHADASVPSRFERAIREKFGPTYDVCGTAQVTLYGSQVDRHGDVIVAFNGYLLGTDDPTAYIDERYQRFGRRFPAFLNGHFSTVVYDQGKDRLFLATDRTGSNMLYYHRQQAGLIFASSFVPFLPVVDQEIDEIALARFLVSPVSTAFSGGRTLLSGVKKLDTARTLSFDGDELRQEAYWDVPSGKLQVSDGAAINQVEQLLVSAADRHRQALGEDLCVAVSGSTESNLLAALMDDVTENQITTVTYGFEDAHFTPGRAVAERLDTDHQELEFNYEPADQTDMWDYEQPVPAFPVFPFRTVAARTGCRSLYTGNWALFPFPYLPRLSRLSHVQTLSRLLTPLDRWNDTVLTASRLIGDGFSRGMDVLMSPYRSSSLVNDMTLPKGDVSRISSVDGYEIGRELEANIDAKWDVPEDTLYDAFLYLQFKEYSQALSGLFSHHADIFTHTPLIEYTFRLPPEQKKRGRLMHGVMQQRYPTLLEHSYQANTRRVGDMLKKVMASDEGRFHDRIDRLGGRSFIDRDGMNAVFDGFESDRMGTDRVLYLMALYHLELWIETFLERDQPWKRPSR